MTVPAAESARHWPHPVYPGTDLLHARYVTHAFGRHRHENQYTFGVVTDGIEDFDYRGTRHHAGPGTVSMVDADAVHTGSAGVAAGWRYQVLYADVDLVRSVARDLGYGGPVSFPQGLVRDPSAAVALLRAASMSSRTCRGAARSR